MKLKKAFVFSADFDNIAPLCSGANLLAEESIAAVLACRACAESLLPKVSKVAWLGKKAEGSMAEDYTASLEELIRSEEASLVLLSPSTRDRCIAAKLAVRLGAAVIPDAAAVCVDDNGYIQVKRNVYGGTAEAVLQSVSPVTIVLASGGLFDDCAPTTPGILEEIAAVPVSGGITLISSEPKQEESVDITAAKRLIGVGRGVGSRENLTVLETLASKIGAELGCTRPIAEEEHWMARGRYIGVSGVTVRPDVYFTFGISGQVQHMVGANDSKVIVAINKDAKAPIFQNCDIGLVADINKVLPALADLF